MYAQEKDLELELYVLTQITIDSLLLLYLKSDNGKEYPVSFTKEGRFSDGEADSPKDLLWWEKRKKDG